MSTTNGGRGRIRPRLLPNLRIPPRRVPRTGDDTPASGLFGYVWRMSGMHQVWVSLIALFVAALSMAPLELQRRIVNDAIGGEDVTLLLWLGSIYLAIVVVQGLAKFAMHVYQGWLSESAIRYTREHLSELWRASEESHDEADRASENGNGSGRTVSVIGAEIEQLGGFVGEGISLPVVNLGMLVAIGGYMLTVEPLVALVALAFLLPQAVIVPVLQRLINRLIERRLGLLRTMGEQLVERPEPSSGEAPEPALPRTLGAIYGNRMRIYLLKFLMKTSTNLLSAMAPLTVLMVGGWFVIQGETTIGVVVAFLSGFDRLEQPSRELLTYYREAAQAVVQHGMVARWMRATSPDRERRDEIEALRERGLADHDPLERAGDD